MQADDRRHVLVVEVRDGDDVADGTLLHEQAWRRGAAGTSGRSGSRPASRPPRSAASTTRRADSRSSASGFWASTCLPASIARRISAGRSAGRVAMSTTATSRIGEHARRGCRRRGRTNGKRSRTPSTRGRQQVVDAGDVDVPRLVRRKVEVLRRGAAADDRDGERLLREGRAVVERRRPAAPARCSSSGIRDLGLRDGAVGGRDRVAALAVHPADPRRVELEPDVAVGRPGRGRAASTTFSRSSPTRTVSRLCEPSGSTHDHLRRHEPSVAAVSHLGSPRRGCRA